MEVSNMANLKGHAKVKEVVGGYHAEIHKIETEIHLLMKRKAELVLGAKHDLKAAGFEEADLQALHAAHSAQKH
jgi:hypothetical protein